MRALAFAVLLAAASLGSAQAPRREGSYAPKGGKAASWRIDDNHSLVWNDARYTPVGVRVDGTAAAVDAANAAGIKDLLIDLPLGADWSGAIAAAEKNGQRYLIRLGSLAPGAAGVEIDPAAYRIAGVTGPKHLDIPLPGATDALVVVALLRDASIVTKEIVPVKDGRLVYDSHINAGLDNVILVYPRTESLELPDFWERLDGHRDTLLARLRGTPFGAGLRGIVDPLGRTATLPGREVHGVPTTPGFQAELAEVLERKYTTVANAMDAWSMGASSLSTGISGVNGSMVLKTTFLDLAHLVPLWGGSRGVSQLWDPGKNKFYNCSKDKSRIWEDIDEAIASAAARRVERLCDGIRRVVDVPIVQEWSGWAGLTEEREPPFDGVAARAAGVSPSELVNSTARTVSTAARWTTRGWLLATDVAVPAKDLAPSLDDLANLGLRAAFVDAEPKAVAPVATARTASAPPDLPIDALFFPENAANPAAVQRLPGGRWWLPTPEDGNRLDFGDSFYGYRMQTPKGSRVVMWARTPGRYLLRLVHPEQATFTTMDGTDPDPKKAKGGVTVTLGQIPVAIDGLNELPVPDVAYKETLDTFARLSAASESGRHVGTDAMFSFSQAADAFDVNPGGNFTEMRTQLRRFATLLSPVSWVEGEAAKDSTFSEVAPFPGASGDRALVLRATLPNEDGYTAEYAVPVVNRNAVELWVAARLPEEHRRELEASVGGVTLIASEMPVSAYGAGFAWYHLGTTRLIGGISHVTLRLRSGVGTEAAIDSVVLAPPSWRPDGLAYPYGLATTMPTPAAKP